MKIEVCNRQEAARIGISRLRALTGRLIAKARRLEPAAEWKDLSVVLMDSRGIAEINARLLHSDAATDVIALRYAPMPGETGLAGELWVNVELALAAGGRPGWNASKELSLYLAHGCDHLCGGEDGDRRGRERMRRRELRWLRRAEKEGLISGLVREKPSRS